MSLTRIDKMKIGRRISYLKKCMLIQELLSKHETRETTRKEVFEKFIIPILGVSYTSFNNMVNQLTPEKQIKLLTAKKN